MAYGVANVIVADAMAEALMTHGIVRALDAAGDLVGFPSGRRRDRLYANRPKTATWEATLSMTKGKAGGGGLPDALGIMMPLV